MAAQQGILKTVTAILTIGLGLTLLYNPQTDSKAIQEKPIVTSDSDLKIINNYNITRYYNINNYEKTGKKNVILILADDLDKKTFNQIKNNRDLAQYNIEFTNHTVTDSLCCPSRVSILTGKYVKNHKVYSNVKETKGGFATFKKSKYYTKTIAKHIKKQNPDIATGFIGKYLNQYNENKKQPGWDTFITPITHKEAYEGYNYTLSINNKKKKYGNKEKDYLNTVLTEKTIKYIEKNKNKQFFLIYSSFLPHSPYEARIDHKKLYLNRNDILLNPDFNKKPLNPPKWLNQHKKLNVKQIEKIEKKYTKRLQATHTLAEDTKTILETLKNNNLEDNTVVIITSDNGYHLGERQLPSGKRTPYYHDTIVPLIIIDPDVTKAQKHDNITSSVDLAPTILDYLDLKTTQGYDGTSIKPLIHQKNPEWRTWVLTEANAKSTKGDPDYTKYAPETFKAIRSKEWLYIVYTSGEKELYNLEKDPNETNNIIKNTSSLFLEEIINAWKHMVNCERKTCIL